MKPPAFHYVRPETVAEAVAAHAAAGDARYLAGGQSLLAALNLRLDSPDLLIDISRIAALRGVRREGDRIVIGAMTRHAEIAADPLVSRYLPLLVQAVGHVAHPAIRNRGTIGGSLALADPAAEMPACALALSANLEVAGPRGTRTIAGDEFFRGTYQTALTEGEILTAIVIPIPDSAARPGFAELARRKGDYAMTGLAMMAGPAPRIVWFALSDRPVRALRAEAALAEGKGAGIVADLATSGISVTSDQNASPDVKRHYARVLLSRALKDLGLP
jgi:carbon-monoxide dehydrogenase medium subunit